VTSRLENSEYDDFTTLDAFCGQLTDDLREVSKDKHLVLYEMGPDEYWQAKGDTFTAEDIAERARNNFGFVKVERLTGNVGYLKLDYFDHPDFAGSTASAAMNFLANSDAVIVDLRDNVGGKENMVKFLLSYFFRESILLINVYDRNSEIFKQSWTYSFVPGKRILDPDVYVLTSNRTASGAEAFAFDLKAFGRATIVGETTKGMAHWVDILELPDYGIRVHVPYARPENPEMSTSWEGIGVQPDIEVPSAEALGTAHVQAMKKLIGECSDEITRRNLEWDMVAVRAQVSPVKLTLDELSKYTGDYGNGEYGIVIKEGQLYWRYSAEVDYVLLPLTADLFGFNDTEDQRFQFLRDDAGQVSGFHLVNKNSDIGNVWPKTGVD
jgi:hypothetical protein